MESPSHSSFIFHKHSGSLFISNSFHSQAVKMVTTRGQMQNPTHGQKVGSHLSRSRIRLLPNTHTYNGLRSRTLTPQQSKKDQEPSPPILWQQSPLEKVESSARTGTASLKAYLVQTPPSPTPTHRALPVSTPQLTLKPAVGLAPVHTPTLWGDKLRSLLSRTHRTMQIEERAVLA